MHWANENFGSGQHRPPSRVIIKTKDPSNPELIKFLEANQFETNQEKTRFQKIRSIVSIIVQIIGGFGFVMLGFALLVFSLFIQLRLSSYKTEIQLLKTLGMAPKQLQSYILKQFAPFYVGTAVVSLLLLVAIQILSAQFLAKKGMYVFLLPHVSVILVCVFMVLIVLVVHRQTVKKYLAEIS
jgi:ABC-type multidrug transport system permease subunit